MLRFKKLTNGNVLLTNEINVVLASFSPAMNIMKHPIKDNLLLITDDSNAHETDKSYVINYDLVDKANCIPVIVANNANELIGVLSESFFFRRLMMIVYEGEFAYNQDITLYDGIDFKIMYEGSTQQFKVQNKNAGWFDVYVGIFKNGSGFNHTCKDLSDQAGIFYFSATGNAQNNFALNSTAAYFNSIVKRENETGKEILTCKAMKAGNFLNCTITKEN